MMAKDQNQKVRERNSVSSAADHAVVEELQRSFKKRVIVPDDPRYEQARAVFYGGIDRRPAAIVRPVDAAGVSQVVSLARDSGLELAVRSGGHSAAGHSLSDDIVLDLHGLRSLEIDANHRTAWAGSGLTTGEYTAAADAYDLATGFGDTASVGLGGLTLGGGVGYLARKHGLTIDNLLAAEVVTADGRIRNVDAEHHPDLFWAIRGGGGNFGVATRFKFRLHPLGQALGGMLVLPATPKVIAGFVAEAENAPEELSGIANVMPAPPMPFVPADQVGKLILMAMMLYAGPVEEGMVAVAPFRALATPVADLLRPMRYPDMFPPEDGSYHPTATARTMFVDHVDRPTAEMIYETLQAYDAPMRVAQIRVLGGGMSRVPVEATAFPHRRSPIMVNLAAFYNGPEDRAGREAWVSDFAAALNQGDSGAYVNFLSDEGEARVRAAYPGETWERLAAVKARYDPTNLFHLNQNVPPARDGRGT